jgi:Lon protease-like protein
MAADEIPDAWPPTEVAAPAQVAPLFPLPRVFLSPQVVMPLHIFEPRYRQMIEDQLDRRGWIVVAPIREGHEPDQLGNPPVYPVGGLGEIVKHTRLPDGRFVISLAGLSRVHLQEVESDRLYRQVRFEPLTEVQPDEDEARRLRAELGEAIQSRSDAFVDLPEELPVGTLADLLLQSLDLPVDTMAEVYAEPVVARRAQFALAEHGSRG